VNSTSARFSVLLWYTPIIALGCSSSQATDSVDNAVGGSTASSATGVSHTAAGAKSGTGGTTPASTGGAASGGSSPAGGGVFATGGTNSRTGGVSASGGTRSEASAGSGNRTSGGSASSGGSSTGGNTGTNNAGGSSKGAGGTATGGTTKGNGGSSYVGGTRTSGGSNAGGTKPTGGTSATGGSTGTGGSGTSTSALCEFTIINKTTSTKIATVGIVEWATTLADLANATIVYTLNDAASGVLNKGGTAPVDLTKTNYRTLLLGLKPSSTYTFHIEAVAKNGTKCSSPDTSLTTGTLTGAPNITRTAGSNPSAQAGGFIVTSGGQSGTAAAYIIDADGTVVWSASAPNQCSRAHMDYEGQNMWMLALNVSNGNGEMRYVSMDGLTSQNNVSGLSKAHHDFTVLPGGIVAAMSWVGSGMDPESELLERTPTGTVTSKFRIGPNVYVGGQSAMGASSASYHSNYIVYHPEDDTFTISDRNPNLFVKVSRTGSPIWQIGGSCANAPAPKCAAGSWRVNHGHDFDANGNMLIFNNGQSGAAHVLEFKIDDSAACAITTIKDYNTNATSNSLGDVQRLPNGNTLITVSNAGQIIQLDPSWATVQTLKGTFGYAGWRETLYGPPSRK